MSLLYSDLIRAVIGSKTSGFNLDKATKDLFIDGVLSTTVFLILLRMCVRVCAPPSVCSSPPVCAHTIGW
jgi:hypothetical protein